MSFGTVIPKTAASFSEYVVDAVESDNPADLPSEEKLKEIKEITSTCLEFAEKFEAEEQFLRQLLSKGFDARKFLLRNESILVLLEKMVLTHTRILAEIDRTGSVLPSFRDLFGAFERFGTAVRKVRDLTKLVITKVQTPWSTIDRQQLEESQAAFARGELKPFTRKSSKNGN